MRHGECRRTADLHRMTMLLLSERAQQAARILVAGAGGGMELKAMTEAQLQWVFTGVEPGWSEQAARFGA